MKVTANGFYKVRGHGKGTSVVLASGTSGGAVVTLGYVDDYGTFIALTDGLVALGSQYKVEHGVDTPIYANVTGATGTTAISLYVNGMF